MDAKKELTDGICSIEFDKDSLGELIMKIVPNRGEFTGQVTVEVHCKKGFIRDIYMTMRSKM